jgi:hypothetical protein
MKIETDIALVDNVYIVTISTGPFSAVEQEKLQYHSEPSINVGGNFVGDITRPGASSPTHLDFTLPDEYRRISSDFPTKHPFDMRDSDDSDCMAKLWANTINDRLASALTTLKSLTEPFVGEFSTTVS